MSWYPVLDVEVVNVVIIVVGTVIIKEVVSSLLLFLILLGALLVDSEGKIITKHNTYEYFCAKQALKRYSERQWRWSEIKT